MAAHVIEETDAGRYQFAHNLIRMTLYDELRMAQRRQFHRAVGNAIEHSAAADLEPFFPISRAISTKPVIAIEAIDYAIRAGRARRAAARLRGCVPTFP